jgi:hypothetical protein
LLLSLLKRFEGPKELTVPLYLLQLVVVVFVVIEAS